MPARRRCAVGRLDLFERLDPADRGLHVGVEILHAEARPVDAHPGQKAGAARASDDADRVRSRARSGPTCRSAGRDRPSRRRSRRRRRGSASRRPNGDARPAPCRSRARRARSRGEGRPHRRRPARRAGSPWWRSRNSGRWTGNTGCASRERPSRRSGRRPRANLRQRSCIDRASEMRRGRIGRVAGHRAANDVDEALVGQGVRVHAVKTGTRAGRLP